MYKIFNQNINQTTKQKILTITLLLLLSVLLGICTVGYCVAVENQSINPIFILNHCPKKWILSWLFVFFIVSLLCKYTKFLYYLHKYRHLAGFLLLVILVIFQISGSSIGCWINIINDGNTSDGVIAGISRPIRSDEWNVFTPLAFSQDYNDYQYFSDIVRATSTDMFMVYGQPIADISMIFRPFQIGYLFLGSSYGLSFYWCSRLICLFLAVYDLFYLVVCKHNKAISFIGAMMITFAPIIQWWFSVNGYVEMIIAISVSVILFDKYLSDNCTWRRAIYTAGIMICAGMFVLTLYPPVMIPMAYVLLALLIYVLVKNIKDKNVTIKIGVKDFISTLLVVILFTCLLARIAIISWDTIMSVMHTAYPGQRTYNGGDVNIKTFFDSIFNVITPMTERLIATNACEDARFIDFCPLGYLMALIIIIRSFIGKGGKLNLVTKIILPFNIFLFIVALFPMPDFIMSISLLSKASYRLTFAIGFSNVIILLACINQLIKEKAKINLVVAFVISVGVAFLTWFYENETLSNIATTQTNNGKIIIALACVLLVTTFLLIIWSRREKFKYFPIIAISLIIFAAGFLVNPIRYGIEVINNQEFSHFIQTTSKNNPDKKWAVLDGAMGSNYLIANGAPTVNSINVYPSMDTWKSIDDGNNEEIYNRYAHINMFYSVATANKVNENKFNLIQNDVFSVNLNVEDLKKLDVSYIVVNKNSECEILSTYMNKLYEDNQYLVLGL